MRGLSNLVAALLLLSIVVPVGVVIVERARSAGGPYEAPAPGPMVSAYSVRNGSDVILLIVNAGPGKASVEGALDSGGTYIRLGISIEEGGSWHDCLRDDQRHCLQRVTPPLRLVLKGGAIVDVAPIS